MHQLEEAILKVHSDLKSFFDDGAKVCFRDLAKLNLLMVVRF
jgi:hypothetical protein